MVTWAAYVSGMNYQFPSKDIFPWFTEIILQLILSLIALSFSVQSLCFKFSDEKDIKTTKKNTPNFDEWLLKVIRLQKAVSFTNA